MNINPIMPTNFGHSKLPIKEMRYTMLTRNGDVLKLGARGRKLPNQMNLLYAEYPIYRNITDGEKSYKIVQITGNPIPVGMVNDFMNDIKHEIKEGTEFLKDFVIAQTRG